jgi:hypothetical protein
MVCFDILLHIRRIVREYLKINVCFYIFMMQIISTYVHLHRSPCHFIQEVYASQYWSCNKIWWGQVLALRFVISCSGWDLPAAREVSSPRPVTFPTCSEIIYVVLDGKCYCSWTISRCDTPFHPHLHPSLHRQIPLAQLLRLWRAPIQAEQTEDFEGLDHQRLKELVL